MCGDLLLETGQHQFLYELWTARQTTEHSIAAQVYGVIGIFGAARYGDKTQGNILVNRWLGGPAEGVLDLAIAAYLSISVPPMQVAFSPS